MTYATYLTIRQILMGLLIFLGVHMIFEKVPDQLKGCKYEKSLRLMGVAFMFVPLSCFLYSNTTRLDLQMHASMAINLVVYYATFLMMTLAFVMLLGRNVKRRYVFIAMLIVGLYSMPSIFSLVYCDNETIELVLTASYAFLFMMIVGSCTFIIHDYRKVMANVENYYSEDVMICVKWVSKSIVMLIGLALTCMLAPVFFAFPRWLRLVSMLYGVGCYFHIYYGYRRMMINLMTHFIKHDYNIKGLSHVMQSVSDKMGIGDEIKQQIQTQLEAWLEARSYLKRDITITSLAKDINTNRTYLSRYINSIHDCSFRVWITRLRVEEAKRLLVEYSDHTLSDIARMIGSASTESFIHIFTRYVGVSPTKWREGQASANNEAN